MMSNVSEATLSATGSRDGRARLAAGASVLGAIAASTCCVIPLVLFSLGITGAWMGQLTAFAPYTPYFVTVTLGFLGYGYLLVYRAQKAACADGEACARPLPNRLVKIGLWSSTVLVALVLAWPYVLPVILG